MTKVCNVCGDMLPVDAFYRDRSKRDGLMGRCKACDHARDRRAHYRHRYEQQMARMGLRVRPYYPRLGFPPTRRGEE
jgi:hypothetical protein